MAMHHTLRIERADLYADWVAIARGCLLRAGQPRRLPDRRGVAVGDVNGDGQLYVVVANTGLTNTPGTMVSVLLNHGNGLLGSRTDFFAGTAPGDLALGIYNDRRLDLVVGNETLFAVNVLRGNGTFAARTSYPVGAPASWWRWAT